MLPPKETSGCCDDDLAFNHQTVMPKEAVEVLNIKPDGLYIDGTFGGGGHSRLIMAALGEKGRLIAFDRDPEALRTARNGWAKDENRLTLVSENFANMAATLSEFGLDKVDGILLDLGLSSHQLFNSGRGFAFLNEDEPLDMRMNPDCGITAEEIVNSWPQDQLANLIYQLGEERASRKIAAAIVRARQKNSLETSGQLAKVILTALWRPGRPPKIHPATKTFMALRIYVNDELGALKEVLKVGPRLIKTGGYLSIISFHSLEDRLVKEAFRYKNEDGQGFWRPLTKKPQIPGPDEIMSNPRSRSAKLRAAERSELRYA